MAANGDALFLVGMLVTGGMALFTVNKIAKIFLNFVWMLFTVAWLPMQMNLVPFLLIALVGGSIISLFRYGFLKSIPFSQVWFAFVSGVGLAGVCYQIGLFR